MLVKVLPSDYISLRLIAIMEKVLMSRMHTRDADNAESSDKDLCALGFCLRLLAQTPRCLDSLFLQNNASSLWLRIIKESLSSEFVLASLVELIQSL